MRKPILTAAAVALVVVACGSAGSSSVPNQGNRPPDPPAHHLPTPAPWPTAAPTGYGGVTYEDPGINPIIDPDEDRVSTFALDVDTASYTIAQRYVSDGNRPDPASVRIEEWVNAFDQDYPRPDDDAFALVADGGPSPFLERDELLLRLGIQARDVRDRARDETALTFVIDTSGSMEREGRLELVKDGLRLLVEELRPDDSVAMVTFGDDARVILPPTRIDETDRIRDAIDELQPSGSTNLEAGLRLGYGLARETLTENGIDRVVLASDGVANVGLTDADGILDGIREDAAAGIELVSVGVGMGNYNDALLEQLADQGDGFYAYVNTIDEARRLFVDDLTGTLQTVALDAKAQVEFEPDAVASYRLVGYENRAIDDHDFADRCGGCRGHRGRPRGHGAVRRPPPGRHRRPGPPRDPAPALDRPGRRSLRRADPRRAALGPGRPVPRHGGDVPAGRDRGRHGRGPARQPVRRAPGSPPHHPGRRRGGRQPPADRPGPPAP